MHLHKTRLILGLGLVMSLALPISAGCAPATGSSKSEADQLQGKWKLVYQEMNGQKLPDEKQAEMFHGIMQFTDGRIHYSVELPGFDFTFAYKLHPDQRPKGIDLTLTGTPDGKGKGKTTLGIYRLREGTLEICHSEANRPVNFSAGNGTDQVLIVLKRAPTPP
jgi:uncharacterized protein (TIGR03067 family)